MFLVGILSWWYGSGWRQRASLVIERISRTSDYFSIGQLATTLFSPFRQISAGGVQGAMGVQMRAIFDQLISRLIGASMRIVMIIFGLLLIALQALLGVVVLIAWFIIPVLPIIGLILTVIGWVPTWR